MASRSHWAESITTWSSAALVGIGLLAGLDQPLGDISELDVEMLGGADQDSKGLITGYALALHENPLGLPDQLTGGQGAVESGESALLVLMGHGRGKGDGGQTREYFLAGVLHHRGHSPSGGKVAHLV